MRETRGRSQRLHQSGKVTVESGNCQISKRKNQRERGVSVGQSGCHSHCHCCHCCPSWKSEVDVEEGNWPGCSLVGVCFSAVHCTCTKRRRFSTLKKGRGFGGWPVADREISYATLHPAKITVRRAQSSMSHSYTMDTGPPLQHCNISIWHPPFTRETGEGDGQSTINRLEP